MSKLQTQLKIKIRQPKSLIEKLWWGPSYFETSTNTIVIVYNWLAKRRLPTILIHEVHHYNLNQKPLIKRINKIPIFNYLFYYLLEEPYCWFLTARHPQLKLNFLK